MIRIFFCFVIWSLSLSKNVECWHWSFHSNTVYLRLTTKRTRGVWRVILGSVHGHAFETVAHNVRPAWYSNCRETKQEAVLHPTNRFVTQWRYILSRTEWKRAPSVPLCLRARRTVSLRTERVAFDKSDRIEGLFLGIRYSLLRIRIENLCDPFIYHRKQPFYRISTSR